MIEHPVRIWWSRFALLHPGWIVALYLVVAFGPTFPILALGLPIILVSISPFFGVVIHEIWSYSVTRFCNASRNRKSIAESRAATIVLILSLAALALFSLLVIFAMTGGEPLLNRKFSSLAIDLAPATAVTMLIANLGFFATHAIAARNLGLARDKTRFSALHAVGYFFAIAYLPIGIWFLRPLLLEIDAQR